jgi:predicted transposase YbfD/YdcC
MLELSGATVTIDAMGCQRQIAQQIVGQQAAHYILAVKENQPTLHDKVKKLLDEAIMEGFKGIGHGCFERARAKSEADECARQEADARAREIARLEEAAHVEAAAIADLHSQAVGVLNIRALVSVALDLSTPNYTKWRYLFLLAVGKYALSDHVLSDGAFPMVPAWARMECTVLGWLHNTISPELSEIVTAPSARHVWLGLEEQVIGNRETRALLLDAEGEGGSVHRHPSSPHCAAARRKLRSASVIP